MVLDQLNVEQTTMKCVADCRSASSTWLSSICPGFDADGFDGLGEGRGRIFGVAHVGAEGDDQRGVALASLERSLGHTRGTVPDANLG
jgi:hypothetical protein